MTGAPPSGRVVIAVDPHKASWTAAALDSSLQPLDVIRVPVSPQGYRRLRGFARRWSDPGWAIEGAAGLGAPLTQRLTADGIDVVDVPAKLAARVRVLSTGHGRKTDEADAVSVGVAALTATRLNTATVFAAITALRALVEHRDDLVKTRTQTVNRLHVLLTHLTPGGAPRGLTADRGADMLRQIRPRDPAAKTLRGLAVDLVAEIRQLDRRIAKAATDIQTAVDTSGSTLAELCGIGTLNAAETLARVGSVHHFSDRRPPSPPTRAPPRSRHPPATSPGIASPAPEPANSTVVCTPWRSPKSPATHPDATTTERNEPPAKATEKHCAASNDASAMLSTASSYTTRRHERGQARRDARGRL